MYLEGFGQKLPLAEADEPAPEVRFGSWEIHDISALSLLSELHLEVSEIGLEPLHGTSENSLSLAPDNEEADVARVFRLKSLCSVCNCLTLLTFAT